MTDASVLKLRAVAFGELQDRLRRASGMTNADLMVAMEEGERLVVRVPLNGEQVKVGTVTYTTGSDGDMVATVTDPEALLRWVEATEPEAVETRKAVKGWKVNELLTIAQRSGEAVDPESGEAIPGITVKRAGGSTAHIAVTREKTDVARAALLTAIFADGTAGLRSLLALPSSPSQTGDSSK